MLLPAAIALVVVFVVWKLFFQEENPVDKLPGPPRKPIVGNALWLMRMKPDQLLDTFVECTKTYGDRYIFRMMNLRVVHISNPGDIEALMSHPKNITKSTPYRFLSAWLGSGLLLSTGAHWHKRRKILTPTFHFNILKNFATVIEEKSRDLVHLLKSKKGAEVDIMPVISDFTLFTICETAMGTKLDKDQSSVALEYKNAILHIGLQMLSRITRFWMHSDFIYHSTAEGKQFAKTLNTAQSFAENVIIERKEQRQQNKEQNIMEEAASEFGTKRRLAMLDLLLEAEEKGEIDMQGIKDEVNTFMFEGHDTTAIGITFCLMLLANHEDVQERIFEECQGIFGDSDRTASMTDLAAMKYLEAVLKETMRLYPSVPYIGREIVEDFQMRDLHVKKGTIVEMHIYELHHREDLYPEPEVFKPERFLTDEKRHPYGFVPFSAGPRNCIGQRFAMQEMKCTISEIVRSFKLVPKEKGATPRLLADLVLRPADPIYIKFLPR